MDRKDINYKEILARTGLNDSEALVYEVLIKNGQVSILSMQKLIPKLSRTNLYNVLHSLAQKSLVQKSDVKKKLEFRPNDPYQLKVYLNNRERELSQAQKMIDSVIPGLSELYRNTTEKPVVRVFEGIEGIKNLYLDTLRSGQPIKSFLGLTQAEETVSSWLRKSYAPLRIKNKITARVIVSADKTDPETASYIGRTKEELRETRVVEQKLFPALLEVQIYGNKVSFANYNKNNALIGVIIENELIAKTMSGLFELAWQGIKAVGIS